MIAKLVLFSTCLSVSVVSVCLSVSVVSVCLSVNKQKSGSGDDTSYSCSVDHHVSGYEYFDRCLYVCLFR